MRAKDHSTGRTTGALLASLPTAIAASIFISLRAPFALHTRFTLGFYLVLPLWITGICLGFLATKGRWVWAVNLALLLALWLGIRSSP